MRNVFSVIVRYVLSLLLCMANKLLSVGAKMCGGSLGLCFLKPLRDCKEENNNSHLHSLSHTHTHTDS